MGMMMFNYGDVLVSLVVLCILERVVHWWMMCWCVFTWRVGPRAFILELSLGKWWWIGVEKSSNISLEIWCWKFQ